MYIPDHDLHIHSHLSICSNDPAQSTDRILKYALDNGLRDICLTDHCWDKALPDEPSFYAKQDIPYISQALPLPQTENVRFHFGLETEMDMNGRIGISPEHLDRFAFIIVPTTHLHMVGGTIREEDTHEVARLAEIYVDRFDTLLHADLPFERVGVAHLTTSLLAQGRFDVHSEVLNAISDETFRELFTRAAKIGIGIELNTAVDKHTPEENEPDYRVYRIAKSCGCKFYFGSDAHHPDIFEGVAQTRFRLMSEALSLTDEDIFRPAFKD